MKVLFIDACVRENSRTRRLAEELIKRIGGDVTRLDLEKEGLVPLGREELALREAFIAAGDYSDPMFRYAKLFSEADAIVAAAPYWDLSFPSSLKVFIERAAVIGLTFGYDESGAPKGLCRAKKLWYVTTMGGAGLPYDFGYGYIKAVCESYYGIPEFELVSAEGLDIVGNDEDSILNDAAKAFDDFR